MAKYIVSVPYVCWVNVEVEADDKDQALEAGHTEAYVDSYVGNGGSNKLIGVYGEGMSIYCCGEPYENDELNTEVKEIE